MKRLLFPRVLLASLLVACGGSSGPSSYDTYTNLQFGYQVSYPSTWTVDVRDPLATDDFEYQSTEIALGRDTVLVTVNYQGGWCETEEISATAVRVSGIEGTEYICRDSSTADVLTIVRFFQAGDAQPTFTIIGHINDDEPSVRDIVQSFEFTE